MTFEDKKAVTEELKAAAERKAAEVKAVADKLAAEKIAAAEKLRPRSSTGRNRLTRNPARKLKGLNVSKKGEAIYLTNSKHSFR
jgi:hypothetical protein